MPSGGVVRAVRELRDSTSRLREGQERLLRKIIEAQAIAGTKQDAPAPPSLPSPRPTEPAPQKVTAGSGRKEEEEAHAREAARKPAEGEQGGNFICSRDLDVGAQALPAAIAVATSTLPGGSLHATGLAMREAARKLFEDLHGTADLVLCFCTESHQCTHVESVAGELFNAVPFAANTTHGGLVTKLGAERVGTPEDAVLALWAIRDAGGTFAVASAPVSKDAVDPANSDASYARAGEAAAAKVRALIQELNPSVSAPSMQSKKETDSCRRHEELLWMFTAPGKEEHVIEGIRKGLPPRSVILGSTSADELLQGHWWQLSLCPQRSDASGCFGFKATDGDGERQPPLQGHAAEGVVVVHLRPSVDFTPVYSHAFSPTVHRARVVSNGGKDGRDLRVLKELAVLGREISGLRWEKIGGNKPTEGRELTAPNLAEALKNQTEFVQKELDDLDIGISDLRYDDFIKSGHAYFKPVAEWKAEPAAEVYNRWSGGYFQTELEVARKKGPCKDCGSTCKHNRERQTSEKCPPYWLSCDQCTRALTCENVDLCLYLYIVALYGECTRALTF